jgi:magnesium transporter
MTSRASRPPSDFTGAGVHPADGERPLGARASGHDGGLWAHVWSPAGGREVTAVEDVRAAYADPATRIWVDLEDPAPGVLAALARDLELPPLVAEDIAERNQRAKVEQTARFTQLVMFALAYRGEVLSTEVDIVLAPRFLLTSHPHDWHARDSPHLRRGVDHYLAEGPDYLLWALVDDLVDGYFPVFDALGDEIEDLQGDVISRPTSWIVERLFQVRRDLITIRHVVSPEREIFIRLTNRESPVVRPERVVYFRDVYDHLLRLTEELDSYRELASTTLDVYLTTVNNRLSEVMKRLTAVTVILAGIGAIAGIFGASEATAAFAGEAGTGFWVMSGLCAGLAASALVFFKRIGWI